MIFCPQTTPNSQTLFIKCRMSNRTNHICSSLAMDRVLEQFLTHPANAFPPLDLGKGVSSFNVFDHIEMQLTPEDLHQHTAYGDINGLASFRQLIANFYGEKFNYALSPKRICITDGASGALAIAFSLLVNNGGTIVLPDSCYPIYRIYAHLFGAHCRFAQLNPATFHIDQATLGQQVATGAQAILINSPSNPHGAVLSGDELAEIAALGVPVIFDETYQALSLNHQAVPSAIHFADDHFIVNSFSKSLAISGFRLGYLIVPERYIEAMTNAKATLNICTSLPSQLVGEQLLLHWDNLLAQHLAMIKENWQIFEQKRAELPLKLYSQPQAGFFATLDVSQAPYDSYQTAMTLATDYGLNTVPGIDFQTPDPGFIRVNIACPGHVIAPALERIACFFADLR